MVVNHLPSVPREYRRSNPIASDGRKRRATVPPSTNGEDGLDVWVSHLDCPQITDASFHAVNVYLGVCILVRELSCHYFQVNLWEILALLTKTAPLFVTLHLTINEQDSGRK